MPTRKTGWKRILIGTFVLAMMNVLCGAPADAGTATLSWQQPTTNVDGTPLTDLAGYKVYYGTSSGVYTNTINVGNVLTHQLTGLSDGLTYYFNVTAYNTGLFESGYATEVSKSMPASQYTLSVISAGTGTGVVTSAPAGISCGAACSGAFAAASSVVLTATPAASSTFTGWSGACSGTGTCAVTMNAAKSVTATFAIRTFAISAAAGANGAIAPSGTVSVNYGAARTFTITPGAGYHVADVLVDGSSVGAVASYSFTNVIAGHSISAAFAVDTFTVTPGAGANGTISPSAPQTVNRNGTASFTITPNSGYVIASVSGCGGALSGSTYTTGPVTANCTVTASFTTPSANTLTVNRTGSGSVVSLPAGINCGQICSFSFAGGTAVTLSATPAPGWTFTGWTGACSGKGVCTVTMNSSASVSALFGDVTPPELTVSSLPDGSVTGNQDLNVSGTVKDSGGLQGLTINGNTIVVNSDTTFSHLVTLSSGKNTITTVATDLAGNKTTDSRAVTLDQAAPGLTITAPADNSATSNSILTLTGTVSETSTVSVALNGGTPQTASMTGTTFTATVILRPGLNTITASALDFAGNPSTSVKRTVLYDDLKPAVAISTPPVDFTTAQGSLAVQGKVTNSLSASTASVAVDGITTPLPLDDSGNFSSTAVFAAEGLHTIAVTATNQAGASASVQRNVQYTRFGDLNSSGIVDLADAVLAFRHITGAQPISDPVVRKRCDVAPLGADGRPRPDGGIDLGDVVIILRKVVGLTNW